MPAHTHYILTLTTDADCHAVEERYHWLGWTEDGRLVIQAREWVSGEGYTGRDVAEQLDSDDDVNGYECARYAGRAEAGAVLCEADGGRLLDAVMPVPFELPAGRLAWLDSDALRPV